MTSQEAKFSANFKPGSAPMLTIRGDSVDEFESAIQACLDKNLHQTIQGLDDVYQGQWEAKAARTAPKPVQSSVSPRMAQVAQSLGATIISTTSTGESCDYGTCPHGGRVAIQGTGQNGSTYKGYFCSGPKGATNKCKTVYLNKNSPEWNTFQPDKVASSR
jgi:hypothetical protein